MNGACQLKQNVDLERCNLRHRLGRVKKLVFCDRFETISSSCVQVNSLDELHVVEKRAESHEVGKADFVTCGYLKILINLKRS